MQTIGLTEMKITYSRPGVKARPIWGALVPMDKVWRTGANEATIVEFNDDVTINGQKLPKGMYSLHTIPGKDEWTVIFNSKAEMSGNYSYDAANDVLRVKAKPEKAEFREWLTFEVPELTTESAKVVLRWENVAIPFTVATGTRDVAMMSIKEALGTAKSDDWRTPFQGAQFAFEHGMTAEANTWLEQSLKAAENTQNLWLKARMQAKAGDRAGAMVTAERAIAKATPQQTGLVEEIRKNIEMWKK